MRNQGAPRAAAAACVGLAGLVLSSCSGDLTSMGSTRASPKPGRSAAPPPARQPAPAVRPPGSVQLPVTQAPQPAPLRPVEAPAASSTDSRQDAARLQLLIAERSKNAPEASYRIGPNDLLEISVFDLAEMNQKVRVDSQGNVQLPLIGQVRVGGLTTPEVARAVASKLAAFVRDPQVNVFILEYKSQEVAVSGSVAKPGLYPLTRDRRTIIDMISEAGGLMQGAGGIVEFIPTSGSASRALDPSKFQNGQPGDPRAIRLELSELMRGGLQGNLDFPVFPGDVIYVPEAGAFTIEGWIDKPGTYPITRNATALAALSAGGGPLFPARLDTVEILRNGDGSNASREVLTVNFKKIRAGEAPDVALRSGDIIRVPGHVVLIIPWGVYTLFRNVMMLGATLPLP